MGFFSSIGNFVCDIPKNVVKGFTNSYELISEGVNMIKDGGVLTGISTIGTGVFSGLGNTITLGTTTAIGESLDDKIDMEADGAGGVEVSVNKDAKGISKFVAGLVAGEVNKLGGGFVETEKALEEGDKKKANQIGAKMLGHQALEAAAVTATVASFGAGAGAVAGGSGAAAVATTTGASVGTKLLALGPAAKLGLASVGLNMLSNKQGRDMEEDFSDNRVDRRVDKMVDEFRDAGYVTAENEDKFRERAEQLNRGYINGEQFDALMQTDGFTETYLTNMYKDAYQAQLDDGTFTKEQYDNFVKYSVKFDMGDIDEEEFKTASEAIMASSPVTSVMQEQENVASFETSTENPVDNVDKSVDNGNNLQNIDPKSVDPYRRPFVKNEFESSTNQTEASTEADAKSYTDRLKESPNYDYDEVMADVRGKGSNFLKVMNARIIQACPFMATLEAAALKAIDKAKGLAGGESQYETISVNELSDRFVEVSERYAAEADAEKAEKNAEMSQQTGTGAPELAGI